MTAVRRAARRSGARTLTAGERALARSVFGEAFDGDGVRVVATPFRTAVTTGRVIWMPADAPCDFAHAPLSARAWFVHELTHVWQFAAAPLATLCSWAGVVACGGYGRSLPGYRYTHPFAWEALNLEQQARVVEHAYVLREGGAVEPATPWDADVNADVDADCGARPLRRAARLNDYAGRTPFEALTR